MAKLKCNSSCKRLTMPNKRMAGPVLIDNAFRKSCLVSNINERPLISFIRNISASSLKPSVAKKR
ncbi:hypothetical protein DERF_013173 [Dermatophagoides farinae]|uniref:Uncharacterized protein n=1 Tax=Dermatophagoides farinae TaxID=6954 RepID=A0A922HL97_DERFA|nr:hypothetical protein DERF_013173 [Dermatophagoides farinae]